MCKRFSFKKYFVYVFEKKMMLKCILLCMMRTFLPKFLRKKKGYALYMGVHYTRQNMV